jgi:hypothetical protein
MTLEEKVGQTNQLMVLGTLQGLLPKKEFSTEKKD